MIYHAMNFIFQHLNGMVILVVMVVVSED